MVPGVVELAAPVLGGITRHDATDLIALVVLPIVGVWAASRLRDSERRCARPATAVFLGGFALAAATATSCSPSVTTDLFTRASNPRIAVAKVGSTDYTEWAVSHDGVHLERGPIASRHRDLLVAEAFDHVHHDTSLGRIVTSNDAVHWQEPANFRRRFPNLDVTGVGRVGNWWVGVGLVGPTTGPRRPTVAFATRDPEHGPWIEHRLPRRDSPWRVASFGAAAFFVSCDGNVIFRPRE